MAERSHPGRERRRLRVQKAPPRSPRRPVPDVTCLQVVDELPRPIPVGRAELDVLEAYLGPEIDALLRAVEC